MFLYQIVRIKPKFVQKCSFLATRSTSGISKIVVKINENLSDYPPIIDTSEEGQRKYFRSLWYDSIKALPSVEEKLHEMVIQVKRDLKKYNLSSVSPTYNGINFQKYITRTHFIETLPQSFIDMNVDSELAEIRETLCETLFNYYCNAWGGKTLHDLLVEPNAGSNLANSLIAQCYKKLSLRNNYIFNSTIQRNTRIFSFWYHGGFGSEEDDVDERNPCFQFEDHAAFTIRGKNPLLPILDMNDDFCSTAEVTDYNYHPEVFQFPHATIPKLASIPGFWPGDPYEFPILLVLTSEKFKSLTSQLEHCDESKIDGGAAVITSFAWLNAIATYQGFTPFHDLTYPLVTQTIVTNGQDWNFFIYQLNTVALHNDVDMKNRRNICWSTGRLRLFDTVEDGRVKGINEEVFKVLLKFLHNAPQEIEGIDLKPYVGTDARDPIEKAHMRFLLRKYYSRVQEHNLYHTEEVPTWVRIYKEHPDAPPSPFVRMF